MSDAMAGSDRFERPAEVLLRDVGEELVILNTASEQYHALNEVGRVSFQLLADGSSIDEATAAICAEYDAPPEQVTSDLLQLASELVEAGLLRRHG